MRRRLNILGYKYLDMPRKTRRGCFASSVCNYSMTKTDCLQQSLPSSIMSTLSVCSVSEYLSSSQIHSNYKERPSLLLLVTPRKETNLGVGKTHRLCLLVETTTDSFFDKCRKHVGLERTCGCWFLLGCSFWYFLETGIKRTKKKHHSKQKKVGLIFIKT